MSEIALRGAPPSDETLMSRIQSDDLRAFELLYDRHRREALGLALRILDDHGLAADAVQEAFVSLWNNRAAYRAGRGRLKWWLLRIVRNRAIDVMRRNRDIVLRGDDLSDCVAAGDCTEAVVLARDRRRELAGAVERLPVEQREVIELAYFEGLSQAEMTRRLGVPLGTIKGRARLGLAKLRTAQALAASA